MIWGCFSVLGVENIEIIEGRMNGAYYRNILERNLRQSTHSLEFFNKTTILNILQSLQNHGSVQIE